jgi:hypothetical protein
MSTADRSHHRESSEPAEREVSEDQRDNTILNIMLCGPSYRGPSRSLSARCRTHGRGRRGGEADRGRTRASLRRVRVPDAHRAAGRPTPSRRHIGPSRCPTLDRTARPRSTTRSGTLRCAQTPDQLVDARCVHPFLHGCGNRDRRLGEAPDPLMVCLCAGLALLRIAQDRRKPNHRDARQSATSQIMGVALRP